MAISFSERQAARKAARERAESAAASALRTIETERPGLVAIAAALDGALAEPFAGSVALLDDATRQDSASGAPPGRVIVTGIGKSGHIGRKIAATLASTGTPAFFVHPAEASHGDLGMITPDDVILALSWSGETAELREHRRILAPLRHPADRDDRRRRRARSPARPTSCCCCPRRPRPARTASPRPPRR